MIERRRAVADDSLAAVLVNTSAGSALPPERKVDYRPKDVALKDEGDELDTPRQINWAPFMAILVVAAFSGLTYLAVTQLGPQIGDMVAAGQRQVAAWQAPGPQTTPNVVATLPPNLTAGAAEDTGQAAAQTTATAAVAAGEAATGATPAAVDTPAAPVVEPTTAPAGIAPADAAVVPPASGDVAGSAAAVEGAPEAGTLSLGDLLPAPTPQAAVPTPAPTPAPATATVNTGANLRAGPGIDYPILGGLPAGQAIAIAGRNADSTWYALSDGSWVFAELVSNPPADVPEVAAPPLQAAPAEAAPAEAAPATNP
jgi:hypothetical protein